MAKKVPDILKVLGWIVAVIGGILKYAQELGVTTEQAHVLARPEGEPILKQIAQVVAGEVIVLPFQGLGHSLLEFLLKAGGFSSINASITADNFTLVPSDLLFKLVEIMPINQIVDAREAILLLKKQGYRPATLFELLSWWLQKSRPKKSCHIVALGSVWNGRAPFIDDDNELFPGLQLRSVDSFFDGGTPYFYLAVVRIGA